MTLIGCGYTKPPLKYIKKWPPLNKILLYFFTVAPGHQWHVKKQKLIIETPIFLVF